MNFGNDCEFSSIEDCLQSFDATTCARLFLETKDQCHRQQILQDMTDSNNGNSDEPRKHGNPTFPPPGS